MIVFIDGENFRQNLAQILADEKYIKNKDDFFKYIGAAVSILYTEVAKLIKKK